VLMTYRLVAWMLSKSTKRNAAATPMLR
jgi:hypothetical protein